MTVTFLFLATFSWHHARTSITRVNLILLWGYNTSSKALHLLEVSPVVFVTSITFSIIAADFKS